MGFILHVTRKTLDLAKVAIGFSFSLLGDGTTNPTTLDLTKDPVFFFSPQPITNTSQSSSLPLEALDYNVSRTFDILKNLPSGVTLGTYSLVGNEPVFTAGSLDFPSASVSGSEITITPSIAFTTFKQVVGLLTFD